MIKSIVLIGAITLVCLITEPQKVEALKPLVSVHQSESFPDGTYVGVHLPLIYNLDMDSRGKGKGVKLEESILAGLVRVKLDVERGSNGKLHGPVKVTFAGITMYDNRNSNDSKEIETVDNIN